MRDPQRPPVMIPMTTPFGGTLFVAHGSPTLVEGSIPAHKFLSRLGQTLPRPRAILCISSHWETAESCLTATRNPETLIDYAGTAGPAQIGFRCLGDPNLARRTAECLRVAGLKVTLNHTRGIDHAVWDPMRCMCPSADVPVVEMSVQPAKHASHHYEVGQALAPLTQEGYLVMGSGLAVRSLKQAAGRADVAGGAPIWAQAFDDWLRSALLEGRYDDVVNYRTKAPFANLAHPTPEHILPLIVTLGAAGPGSRTHAINTGFGFTSISQACFYFQCQSDSPEDDPVANALGVNTLPLTSLLSASLSKRAVPVHRPKTRRKTLASARSAPMLVSEAHLSALQKCVLEQTGGPNPRGKKSPLEARLEHVLAAKQDTLTPTVSLVKKSGNQVLAAGVQPSSPQQKLLESIRAQRPVPEGARSGANPGVSTTDNEGSGGMRGQPRGQEALDCRFQFGRSDSEGPTSYRNNASALGGVVGSWAGAPPLERAATDTSLPVLATEIFGFAADQGTRLQDTYTHAHSPPKHKAPRPAALHQTLEALFGEARSAGHSSDSSSGGQPLMMDEQARTEHQTLSELLSEAERVRFGASPSYGFHGLRELDAAEHSGTGRDGGEGSGRFAPRTEASGHQQEATSKEFQPGTLDSLRGMFGGAFAGRDSPGVAGSSFGKREARGSGHASGFGGSEQPWREASSGPFIGGALKRDLTLPESTASAMLSEEAQHGGGFYEMGKGGTSFRASVRGGGVDEVLKEDPMIETRDGEGGDSQSKWTAEQEYAADAMLAGLSQPDWWLWSQSPKAEEPKSFGHNEERTHKEEWTHKEERTHGETGDCYQVTAAQETAANAMLAGMSQPDWWSWVDMNGL